MEMVSALSIFSSSEDPNCQFWNPLGHWWHWCSIHHSLYSYQPSSKICNFLANWVLYIFYYWYPLFLICHLGIYLWIMFSFSTISAILMDSKNTEASIWWSMVSFLLLCWCLLLSALVLWRQLLYFCGLDWPLVCFLFQECGKFSPLFGTFQWSLLFSDAIYLRSISGSSGCWPLLHLRESSLSFSSVKFCSIILNQPQEWLLTCWPWFHSRDSSLSFSSVKSCCIILNRSHYVKKR